MKIIITESQASALKYNQDAWGCDLFPYKSNEREWCKTIRSQIGNKQSKVEDQVEKVGKFVKNNINPSFSERIKHYAEDDPFFAENISNLKLLDKYLSPTCDKVGESIEIFKRRIAKKFLFVDKINGKFTYNKITRLNSNHNALAYLLTDFKFRKKLFDEPFENIFKRYFETPIGLSGETPFFNLIIGFLSKNEDAVRLMDNVLKTIKGTDDVGVRAEAEAYIFLSERFGKNNIKTFIGDYSWVDFLGVDMIVHDEDFGWGWVPVQIKNKIESCKPNSKFCKNICVGKHNNTWHVKVYDNTKEIHPSQI